jgi:hypothetical protein
MRVDENRKEVIILKVAVKGISIGGHGDRD